LAIKPKDNEAFYREVDEELRRDQVGQIWERYRWLIVGGVAFVLFAVAGFIWWQNQSQARAAGQAEALVEALGKMQKGEGAQAEPKIAEIEQSGIAGYRAAGLFSRANLMVESGNVAGAVQVLQRIASDEGLAEPYRHAALVRQTALEFDRLQPAQIVQRLQPLAQRGQPWFGSAGELVAFAHVRQQRLDLAGPIFVAIAADETVPESIRSRAVQMAGALGMDVPLNAGPGGAQPAPQPSPQPAAKAAPATKE
jgi:hypothetical protein